MLQVHMVWAHLQKVPHETCRFQGQVPQVSINWPLQQELQLPIEMLAMHTERSPRDWLEYQNALSQGELGRCFCV